MVMLVFALPEEARAVRRRVRWNKPAVPQGVFAGEEVSLSFAGIGAKDIAKVEQAIELLKPRTVICSGFAGATRSMLEAGDFVLATNYTDPDLREAVNRQRLFDAAGPFVQAKAVASVADKWSLNRSVGSMAVDMESEAVADLCRRRHVPLVTARMISDAIDETIPAVFTGKKVSGPKDLSEAVIFAARMLRLTERLADRLETLVGVIGRIDGFVEGTK
jgi:adenosylhomocysteine nucleosidase